MNDTELRVAKECGLLPDGELPKYPVEKFVDYQDLKESLEEYTARICAEKDAEKAEAERIKGDDANTLLRRQLAEVTLKLESAEQRNREAMDQEPVGEYRSKNKYHSELLWYKPIDNGTKFYTKPIPSPDIAELQRENAELEEIYADTNKALNAVVRENAELRKDAKRYRWLTKYAYIGDCFTDKGIIFEVSNVEREVPIKAAVSDAIDAAMQQEAK